MQSVLTGGTAFAPVERILSGLTFETAIRRLPGAQHTIYELLWHSELSQRLLLDLASGREVTWPEGVGWWPQAAPSEAEFRRVLRDLRVGLQQAEMMAADPSEAAREVLTDLATHSAYHWGQIVLLRQLMNDWTTSTSGAAGA
nr:DinB family protein [Deinobacterium chartae]